MVVGTITERQGPALRRIYEQMCEPKWVIAFGVCASTGGFYQNYTTMPGADQVIPVDVYIPGCPPRPEQVLDGAHAAAGRDPGAATATARSRERREHDRARWQADAHAQGDPSTSRNARWRRSSSTR